MSGATPQQSEVDKVSEYLLSLDSRYPMYMRAHREHHLSEGADRLGLFVSEYLTFGGRETYEGMLLGMLSAREQNLLHADKDFTKAWNQFVQIRWAQKRIARFALIFGVVVVLPAALLLLGLVFFGTR